MTVHVVRSGENLWAISNLYGVTIQTIVSENGLLSGGNLVPGLALYLPDNLPVNRTYQIKAGDQIWQIAKKFYTDISSILKANPTVNPNQLFIGQIITIPTSVKMKISTLGFVVPSSDTVILPIIDQLAAQLSYLAVVAYSFTNEGYAYNEMDDSAIVARCHERGITPLLMIRNFTGIDFSAELAGNVLGYPPYRQNLVMSIVNLVKQRGYGGVSIDFEFIPPPQRQSFNLFLSNLKKALGELILHVNVHAKTEDLPTNRIIGAYDYAAIGAVADIVAVMTIDYGYPGGPPDPISPIWWMEQVIQYSITQIDPRKLQIAMPLYGYDKTVYSNATQALSVADAQNLAISTGSPIQFDEKAMSPWYRYWVSNVEHVVWFEDIRGFIEKYRLIDRYQLSGTTFWQISLPAPQNWSYLSRNITVVKE